MVIMILIPEDANDDDKDYEYYNKLEQTYSSGSMKIINNGSNEVDTDNNGNDDRLSVLYFVIFGLSVAMMIALSIIIYLAWTNKKRQ